MKTLRIFLVDDHMIIREGLKALINAQPDMNVIDEASSGTDICAQMYDCAPDVVIMDISMPGTNGIEATAQIRRTYPMTHVLILSIHNDPSYLRQILAVGGTGYILKHTAADALIQAIRIVAAGGVYLEPSLVEHVVARYVRQPSIVTELLGKELSERESEVAQRVAQGYSNKDIAAQLTLSVKTVETYRARAMEKLGLESRAALVRYALERGWLHMS